MNRFLIIIASIFFAFIAISSTATASPAEWAPSIQRVAVGGDRTSLQSWATVPSPRLFAFVTIQL